MIGSRLGSSYDVRRSIALLAWTGSLGTLLLGHQLARALGRRGVVATERLMGMVLCVIAVHIMLTGLESFFSAAFCSGGSSAIAE